MKRPSPRGAFSLQASCLLVFLFNFLVLETMRSSYRFGLFLVLLVLAIAALYGQFLWNPIVFDDLPYFMIDNEGNQPISSYHYSLLELRSLPYATLAWSKEWFGLEMWHFRVENLLLHVAVSVALFAFLRSFFAGLPDKRGNGALDANLAAFLAALIFALHPVATYAVGYLVQRTIMMATLFSLLSMLAYLHGSIRENRAWLWASVAFYYLAVFSKEHAIMLPMIAAAMTVLLHADWKRKIMHRWPVFVAFVLIALFVLLAKKGLVGSVYEINAPGMLKEIDGGLAYPLSVLTQSWLFFKYAGLWLFPNPEWMSIDMREPFAQSLLSPYMLAFVCFVAWGVMGAVLLFRRGAMGLLGFAMLFPWLMFMTEISTVRIQEGFVLYRSYLWAAGACCVLPLLFWKSSAKAAVVLSAAIVLAVFPISMERLSTMSHPVLLWDDAEKLVKGRTDLPGVYRIYYNRGTELIKIDQYDRAITDLKLAISLHPDLTPAYGNMGAAYLKKHDWQNAVDAFTRVMEIARRTGERLDMRPFLGRAIAYEKMGELEKAELDYRMSCELGKRGCDKVGLTNQMTDISAP